MRLFARVPFVFIEVDIDGNLWNIRKAKRRNNFRSNGKVSKRNGRAEAQANFTKERQRGKVSIAVILHYYVLCSERQNRERNSPDLYIPLTPVKTYEFCNI